MITDYEKQILDLYAQSSLLFMTTILDLFRHKAAKVTTLQELEKLRIEFFGNSSLWKEVERNYIATLLAK